MLFSARLRESRFGIGLATGAAAGPVLTGLAAFSSPMIAGGVMAGLLVAGAAISWPFYGFLLTVLAVPVERMGRLTNDIDANTFSIMRAMGLLNLAGLLLHTLLRRRKVQMATPVVIYGAYVFIGLLTLTHTSDMNRGLSAAGAMVGNLLFLFLTTNIIRDEGQARIAVAVWLAMTVAIGLFTIYQWHNPAARLSEDRYRSTGARTTDERFSTVLEDAAEVDLSARMPRASGTSSHPTVYAINTILTLPFFAYFIRTGAKRWSRIAAMVGGMVASYNILLTNTRAALIVMVVTLAMVVVMKLLRPEPRVALALLFGAIALIPLAPPEVWNRILDLSNYSRQKSATLNARLYYWDASVAIFRDNPVFGIGIGNQSEVPKRVTQLALPPNTSVHNEYIESLLEVGMLGYPVLIAFMVALYRRCRYAERFYREQPETGLLLTAARIGFVAVLLYAVQVDVMHFPLKGWWLAMGLIVALSELARKQAAERAPVAA